MGFVTVKGSLMLLHLRPRLSTFGAQERRAFNARKTVKDAFCNR